MTWTTDGWPFWEPWAEEHEEPWDHPGLWHVTTAASDVLRHGALRSRRDLRASGARTRGLGGGYFGDVAPDKISAVTNPVAASRLARAMQVAALAAQDRLPAWRVAWEAMQWSNVDDLLYTHDEVSWALYGDEDDRSHLDLKQKADEFDEHADQLKACLADVWGQPGWPDTRGQAAKSKRLMDRRWNRDRPGRSRYELIRVIERCASNLRSAIGDASPGDVLSILAPVGFTEAAWDGVDPRDVKVLRLAARLGASADIEPSEAELRFDPADVRIVGVETPSGLVRLERARRA